MPKLILNPAYKQVHGKPTCNHKKTVVKLGGSIYEFCDECMIVWIH